MFRHFRINSELDPERHRVVATAHGVFGREGGTLTSEETGVSINIPPGALNTSKQEIYFKVCQDTSMLPPLDTDRGNEEIRLQINLSK